MFFATSGLCTHVVVDLAAEQNDQALFLRPLELEFEGGALLAPEMENWDYAEE